MSKSASALICLIQYKEKKSKFPCAYDSLTQIWCLYFVLLSDLSSTASPHILSFACVADGTILPYMLVDLPSKINRTVLSADKCTRTYNGVISIIEAILDKTQGCLLVDLLVPICVCERLQPSICLPPCDPAKVHPVVTGKITGN